MNARFDTEVMEHLDKLYHQHLINLAAHSPRGGAARMSAGECAAFASPGQNPAVFHKNVSARQTENQSEAFDSLLQSFSDDGPEDFTNEEILQPRRLSLRVF